MQVHIFYYLILPFKSEFNLIVHNISLFKKKKHFSAIFLIHLIVSVCCKTLAAFSGLTEELIYSCYGRVWATWKIQIVPSK